MKSVSPAICLILVFSCFDGGQRVGAVHGHSSVLSGSPSSPSPLHWGPAISKSSDDRSRLVVAGGTRLERSLLSQGSCLEQSEVSENTIIRTKDSRALGARFLNETSLGLNNRDQCLSLCCSFHGCNVAVYEEKDGGNCYLFDCGPADDFRCKFTSHSHYSSGVIRENAHEEELAQLKNIDHRIIPVSLTTTSTPVTQPLTRAPVATSTTVKPARSCSRYQFECHTTGECIAIYNACDGIPQCADGSDEAPELGCPATTTEAPTTKLTTTPLSALYNKSLLPTEVKNGPSEWRNANRDRYADRADFEKSGDTRWRNPDREAPRNYNGEPRRVPYQQPPNNNGEAYPEPDRSANHYYNPDANHHYGSNNAWPERNNNDYRGAGDAYDRYSYDKEAGRVPYDPAGSSAIHANRKHAEWDRNRPQTVPLPPIAVNNRSPPLDHPVQIQHISVVESEPVIRPLENQEQSIQAGLIPSLKVEHPTAAPIVLTSTTLVKPSLVTKENVLANHAHVNHFHVNQAVYQEEKAERSRQTVGAAWALTLGLSVTSVLVLLVGCRLRSLKRHLRRGRNGHTRDADYLVNGMYL